MHLFVGETELSLATDSPAVQLASTRAHYSVAFSDSYARHLHSIGEVLPLGLSYIYDTGGCLCNSR
jgi:hypothetical protein